MRKLFLSLLLCTGVINALACTNFIVGKKASADGSVMCTYSADDYGMFLGLCHYPAGKHAKGEMLQIYDWDTKEYHGQIPQAAETYNVIGNINEYQVTIGETTFGGREEMVDTTGIIDYGSLIYIALQRSKTAREAISVMTRLVETYGFCSEGETFTICDPNEAWIMEMMGKGPGSKGVVWVAVRIPDDAICAHANQSRIRTFDQKDKKNVMFSKDCIKFARSKGWFTGKDKDFSFCDVYAAPTFSGRRACEARVWSFFNRFGDMDKYLPYVEGKVKDAEPMPLWIVPNKKVSLQDLEASMRDHYEGTPFDLGNDLGQGVWEMPYRPTPLSFKVDGKAYFNERPVSTQQTAFSYVSQMRSWLPRQIGGVLWFGNDDGNMVAYTPIYCGNTVQPECYNTPGADAVTFSDKNAFWVCNWVSNMVYPRYSQMFPSLKEVRDSLDNSYIANQGEIEKQALKLYGESEQKAVDYLTDYSNTQAQQMLARWKELAIYLIVKYNDMAVKPTKDGKFLRTKTGNGATVKRTGFPEKVARALVKQTGDRFASPE
ncbi:dipeptidase [Prevotella pectinovora]|uniref:dipeptidase n=1 Tax=Prevotella pectinovora TaxID=1602169 RepID=UPI00307DAC9F